MTGPKIEWHFDRYRDGRLKAQGIMVHADTEAEAWEKAVEILHIDGNLQTDELRPCWRIACFPNRFSSADNS
jgi:hypothetical protein